MNMTESITSKTYDVWSVIYDKTFGALVHKRQIAAVRHVRFEPGQRILDIGVGTGMTLRHYPDHVTVVGMDLSAGMLRKAAEKCRAERLEHCRLVRADAMAPPFAEASFDHIVISHTISVVSDPGRLIRWAAKLVKPTGQIVILNHFHSTQPVVGWFEKLVNPLCVKIGWRSDLSLESVLSHVPLEVNYYFKMGVLDFWRIISLSPPRGGGGSGPARRPVATSSAGTEPLSVPSGRLAVDAGR